MHPVARVVGKLALLALFAAIFWVGFTLSLPLATTPSPEHASRGLTAALILGKSWLFTAAWSAAFAFPLAIVYGRHARLAALAMALPVAVTWVLLLSQRPGQWLSLLVNSATVLGLLVLAPALAHLARRMMDRHATYRAQATG